MVVVVVVVGGVADEYGHVACHSLPLFPFLSLSISLFSPSLSVFLSADSSQRGSLSAALIIHKAKSRPGFCVPPMFSKHAEHSHSSAPPTASHSSVLIFKDECSGPYAQKTVSLFWPHHQPLIGVQVRALGTNAKPDDSGQ